MPAAIVFVATSDCTWSQLPPGFGLSGVTPFRRFTEWTKARVGAKLHHLIPDELGARGELDWSRCAIDSVSTRALKGGHLTGPNPADRGKQGSKMHLLVDRQGLPLSIGISAANLHDSQALIPLVRGIAPIRSHRGPRRRRPGKLQGDKGYDYRFLRRRLASRGIRHRLRHGSLRAARGGAKGHGVLTSPATASLERAARPPKSLLRTPAERHRSSKTARSLSAMEATSWAN